ncbi:MAG: hypothetical protein ABI632_13815 [Pseudolysinimonas sp.]
MTYDVEVSREGSHWLATIRGLEGAHTYAGNMTALHANIQEVIALVNDEPADAEPVPIRLLFDDGMDELLTEAVKVGEDREHAESTIAAVQEATHAMAARMAAAGYSVRDIAGLLRVTPGRVSQLLAEHRPLIAASRGRAV